MAFICARNQHSAHNLLLRSFKQSGMTQKELAERTGIDEAVVSRVFRRPCNLELNTFSKLLYGIRGAALEFAPAYAKTKGSTKTEDTVKTIYSAETPGKSWGVTLVAVDTARAFYPFEDITTGLAGSNSKSLVTTGTREMAYAYR